MVPILEKEKLIKKAEKKLKLALKLALINKKIDAKTWKKFCVDFL